MGGERGCYIYVLGEGIISIRVQGGSFIIDVINRGVHLWNSRMAVYMYMHIYTAAKHV